MTINKGANELVERLRAHPGDARLALYVGAALEDEGRREAAVAAWSLGDDADAQLRRVKDNPNAPEEYRRLSARADKAIREHFTALHAAAIAACEEKTGKSLARVLAGIWSLTHDRDFAFRVARQKPVIFYMPDLPASPVTPNDELSWVASLEASWVDIRREYEEAVRANISMAPYVPAATREKKWSRLRGRLDWSSIHLFRDAIEMPAAVKFPRTVAALQAADLVRIENVPLEAFFSRLKPGAHIPPHYGLTNTRLTVHLPIIVPDDCAIRVGDTLCHWTEGKVIAFDDSYDHEAWNRSQRDRVVLIFEAHHPDLAAEEKMAIEHAYSVRRTWLQNRWRLLE